MRHPATSGFLSPYRVLDLTDHRGLLAGWMLARLGADVIQVEPPSGSPARRVAPLDDEAPAGEGSLYWSVYASCKRGITCSLDTEEGRGLFLRLVERADFVLESFDSGTTHRLGIDYAALRTANPRIIHVSITAFGAEGPKASYADSDLIVWAASGALHPSRSRRGVPLRVSVPQAYLHGAADAAGGALIALFGRRRTGRGQHVEVSTQRSAALATLSTTLAAAVGHEHYQFPADPVGKKKSLDLSGSGVRTRRSKWRVRDGLLELHLGIGPASGGSANRLFAWMREQGALPEEFADWDWITLPQRLEKEEVTGEQMDRAREAVARFLARYSKAELASVALERGILMAPIMTVEDLAKSEQLRGRRFFETVSESGRPRTIPGRLAAGCDAGFAVPRPAPARGEHNLEVYSNLLGLGVEQIEALTARGVI